MSAVQARVVVGWRARQQEQEEARLRALRAAVITGRRGEAKALRETFKQSAAERRAYKARWAREHPEVGKRWRRKNRERDAAASRARYWRNVALTRARERERAARTYAAILAEGGEILAEFRARHAAACRRYRERKRKGGPVTDQAAELVHDQGASVVHDQGASVVHGARPGGGLGGKVDCAAVSSF